MCGKGLIFFLPIAIAVACDNACLAYQWGYPLWHMANLRYAQTSRLFPLKPVQKMNHLALRRDFSLQQKVVLCNAILCSGDDSFFNPMPVVAPNIDSIYGAAYLDIQSSFLLTLPPSNGRFYSVHFLNMYTDSIGESLSANNYPQGGIFCLYSTSPQCSGDVARNIQLPRFGFLTIRVYSEGQNTPCGNDGCDWLEQVTFQEVCDNNTPCQVTLNVKEIYEPTMGHEGCPYVYEKPPCGDHGDRSKFWDALCTALGETPLEKNSPEATYVDSQFSSLGIHYNGCTALNYQALNRGLVEGYEAVNKNIYSSPQTWSFLPYNGTWGIDYLTRVVTSTRLHDMNTNQDAVYYTAFTDSQHRLLNGEYDYKVIFSPSPTIPINISKGGFWSLTLYDDTYYLVHNRFRKYAIRGEKGSNIPPKEIDVKHNCAKSDQNCIVSPSGLFNLMLRGYSPLDEFQPGGSYPLPTILRVSRVLGEEIQVHMESAYPSPQSLV